VADRPLRPATHRRLGRPLPHQLANAPRTHPNAEAEASFPPKSTSGISSSFLELSRSLGQIIHVLLTRSRLCPRTSPGSSLHLHVLGTPPAFILSQDQTLRDRPHEPKSPNGTVRVVKACARLGTPEPRTLTGIIDLSRSKNYERLKLVITYWLQKPYACILLSFQGPSRSTQ
jgi:hypothetical protein